VNTILTPRARRTCPEEARERELITARSDTLYILMRRVATGRALGNLERQGLTCVPFDDGYACSTIDLVPLLKSASTYARGTELRFGRGGTTGAIEGPGWGITDGKNARLGEPFEGERTSLHFVVDRGAPKYVLDLELDVAAADGPPGDLEIEANGIAIATLALSEGASRVRVEIPGNLPSAQRYVAIDLKRASSTRPVHARSVSLRDPLQEAEGRHPR
jgi:hypothetical protein